MATVFYITGLDGVDTGAVKIDWNPVTTAQDGSPLPIKSYQIEISYDDQENWSTVASVASDITTTTITDIPLPSDIWLRVRATSFDGTIADPDGAEFFSLWNDVEPPDAPTTPTVNVRLGVLTVEWDGLLTTGAVPDDFKHVEVHLSTTSGFTPDETTKVGALPLAGMTPITGLPYDTPQYVKFVAVDMRGNASDPSAEATGTPVPLVSTDVVIDALDGAVINDGSIVASEKVLAGSVTTLELAANAVTTDKLAANSVETANLAAGAIDSFLITGAIMQSSAPSSGLSRWEADTYGIRLLDSSGATTVDLDATTGTALITGAVNTGLDPKPYSRLASRTATNVTSSYPVPGDSTSYWKYTKLSNDMRFLSATRAGATGDSGQMNTETIMGSVDYIGGTYNIGNSLPVWPTVNQTEGFAITTTGSPPDDPNFSYGGSTVAGFDYLGKSRDYKYYGKASQIYVESGRLGLKVTDSPASLYDDKQAAYQSPEYDRLLSFGRLEIAGSGNRDYDSAWNHSIKLDNAAGSLAITGANTTNARTLLTSTDQMQINGYRTLISNWKSVTGIPIDTDGGGLANNSVSLDSEQVTLSANQTVSGEYGSASLNLRSYERAGAGVPVSHLGSAELKAGASAIVKLGSRGTGDGLDGIRVTTSGADGLYLNATHLSGAIQMVAGGGGITANKPIISTETDIDEWVEVPITGSFMGSTVATGQGKYAYKITHDRTVQVVFTVTTTGAMTTNNGPVVTLPALLRDSTVPVGRLPSSSFFAGTGGYTPVVTELVQSSGLVYCRGATTAPAGQTLFVCSFTYTLPKS